MGDTKKAPDAEVEAAKEGGKYRAWRGADGKVKRIKVPAAKADTKPAADDDQDDDQAAGEEEKKPAKKKPAKKAAGEEDGLSGLAIAGIILGGGLLVGLATWAWTKFGPSASSSSTPEGTSSSSSAETPELRVVEGGGGT